MEGASRARLAESDERERAAQTEGVERRRSSEQLEFEWFALSSAELDWTVETVE